MEIKEVGMEFYFKNGLLEIVIEVYFFRQNEANHKPLLPNKPMAFAFNQAHSRVWKDPLQLQSSCLDSAPSQAQPDQ